MLGLLLVLLGAGLLVEQLVPALSITTLLLLAVGAGLCAAWLKGRLVGATVPGLVLLGWGLARLVSELGYAPADGITPAFVGLALLVAWAAGRSQGAPREWALWLGIALAVFGLADAIDLLPEVLSLEVLVPVAVIGLGIWVITRARGQGVSQG